MLELQFTDLGLISDSQYLLCLRRFEEKCIDRCKNDETAGCASLVQSSTERGLWFYYSILEVIASG
jgi:hypothetical protein